MLGFLALYERFKAMGLAPVSVIEFAYWCSSQRRWNVSRRRRAECGLQAIPLLFILEELGTRRQRQ